MIVLQDRPLHPSSKVGYTINPVYDVDRWGRIKLGSWLSNVQTLDVSEKVLDYSKKSKGQLRLVFELNPSSLRYQRVPGMIMMLLATGDRLPGHPEASLAHLIPPHYPRRRTYP